MRKASLPARTPATRDGGWELQSGAGLCLSIYHLPFTICAHRLHFLEIQPVTLDFLNPYLLLA